MAVSNMICFALFLCCIVEAVVDTTVSTTDSIRISSNLHDIVNQESLVRLSMVQQMQILATDVMDLKNKVETLTDSLKRITEEMHTSKAETKKQQEKTAGLNNIQNSESESNAQMRNITSQYLSAKRTRCESGIQELRMKYLSVSAWGTNQVDTKQAQIQFNTSFEDTPSLTYGFVELNSFNHNQPNAELFNLTRSGFALRRRRDDYSCKISWMACGY